MYNKNTTMASTCHISHHIKHQKANATTLPVTRHAPRRHARTHPPPERRSTTPEQHADCDSLLRIDSCRLESDCTLWHYPHDQACPPPDPSAAALLPPPRPLCGGPAPHRGPPGPTECQNLKHSSKLPIPPGGGEAQARRLVPPESKKTKTGIKQ